MSVKRILAGIFMVLALIAFGAEILMALEEGAYSFLLNGEVWFAIDPASLNAVQAGIQRYIHPFLWDPVIVWFLRWPLWLLPLILAVLFWLMAPRKRKKGKIFG